MNNMDEEQFGFNGMVPMNDMREMTENDMEYIYMITGKELMFNIKLIHIIKLSLFIFT